KAPMPFEPMRRAHALFPALLRRDVRSMKVVVEVQADDVDVFVARIGILGPERAPSACCGPIEPECSAIDRAHRRDDAPPIRDPGRWIVLCGPGIPICVELPADAYDGVAVAVLD